MEHHNQETYRPKGDWSAGMKQDTPEKSEFFILERQMGKTVEMVNFCLKSGSERAFAVMGFDEVTYDPSKGIVIFGRAVTIQIVGRHLQILHKQLVSRKVKEVRAFGKGNTDGEELFIEEILVHSDYEGH